MDVEIGPVATKFALGFGKVAVALLFLEHGLRLYLAGRRDLDVEPVLRGAAELTPGHLVREGAFTDGASYGELIARYNEAVRADHPELVLDPDIERVRDLVANGRMSPLISPAKPFALLKFAPAPDGRRAITAAQSLSEEWLDQQFARLLEAMRIIDAALRARRPTS